MNSATTPYVGQKPKKAAASDTVRGSLFALLGVLASLFIEWQATGTVSMPMLLSQGTIAIAAIKILFDRFQPGGPRPIKGLI